MNSRYVLLTSAKDEQACIAEVIELVLCQSVLPEVWHIVDDGSSDRTAEIVEGYARTHPFIRLHGSGARGGRNFGSQYKALQAAYELARAGEFEFIAVQDADQAPAQADYYEQLMRAFERDPKLGMASGLVYERSGGVWCSRPSNSQRATAGSVVFRRECFEAIGGYTPLEYGGSDWLAQIAAKMAGWRVATDPALHLLHYRPTSSAGGLWRGRWREGMMDASFGTHALFECLKCARRMASKPFVLGAVTRLAGFMWWHVSGRPPVLPAATVAYLRREQLSRLWRPGARLPGPAAARRGATGATQPQGKGTA